MTLLSISTEERAKLVVSWTTTNSLSTFRDTTNLYDGFSAFSLFFVVGRGPRPEVAGQPFFLLRFGVDIVKKGAGDSGSFHVQKAVAVGGSNFLCCTYLQI
jgi:hypothetical protein